MDKGKCIDQKEEFKHLDHGWSYVILFASFCTFCLIGANNYGTGIIHKVLLQRYQRDVSLTAWSGALQLGLVCFTAPVASIVTDKFSCRTSVAVSGVLYIFAYMTTTFVSSLEVAIFTCGVTTGFAGGFGYTASIVVINYNFKKRKNFALGIALSGMGAGIFAFAPLMDIAYNYYGSSGFFITMASISANITAFGMLMFPSQLEIYSQRDRENRAKQEQQKASVKDKVKVYYHAVVKKPMLLLCLYAFGFGFGTDLVFLHFPTYIISTGLSSQTAALLVSLNGLVSAIGRTLIGCLANLINEIRLLSICLFFVGAFTIVFPFVSSYLVGIVLYAILLGLLFGSGYVLASPCTLHFVDLSFSSAAIGVVFISTGTGSIVGPVFAGFVIEKGGSYQQCFIVAGSAVLVAALCGSLSLYFKQNHVKEIDLEVSVLNPSSSSISDNGMEDRCQFWNRDTVHL